MLPGDITGSSIIEPAHRQVRVPNPGPVFCSVLLADEINRATPKTQSSLLEAMAERRVSADGVTYDLPRALPRARDPNNPDRASGPRSRLPEAQARTAFLFKMSLGYMGPRCRARRHVRQREAAVDRRRLGPG